MQIKIIYINESSFRRENGKLALKVRAYHLEFYTRGADFERVKLARNNLCWLGVLGTLVKFTSWRFLAPRNTKSFK